MILVSRLINVKHPEDMLQVLAEARRRHPALAAVFVGDGPMRDELESTAAALGVTDDVRFVGNKDQDWISAGLASADIVLSPLTGRALVEAALSATPVIAYDVEWHSELITTGQTGILVPFRDTAAMADAVCHLLDDPAMAASLGEKARAATLESMNPAVLMAHERAEYEKLLAR
jgi:glycogen(starch) synthase